MNTEHLAFIPNLALVFADVMAPSFQEILEGQCDRAVLEGRIPCVLGLHLCGFLSVRLVELFNRISSIAACVLSPCCMPSALQKEQRRTQRAAKVKHREYTPEVDVYTRWCTQVYCKLQEQDGIPRVCGILRDPHMLSPKSIVMWTCRG
jgi:hypothetical protein